MPNQSPPDSPRRRPKGDKRARTRAKILDAARQLVWEKGYEQATVQEIARRAGVSNGAIYGNFRDRDDLLAALGPAYWPRVRPEFAPGATLPEILEAMAEATIAALPARRRAGVSRLTGMAYALEKEGLRTRAEEVAVRRQASAAAWWRSVIAEDRLPMPAEAWVLVLGALIEGLTFQWLLTPDLVSDRLIRAAFAALAPSEAQQASDALRPA